MAKIAETAALVSEVLGDTKTLFELQIKLLRAEIQELAGLSKRLIFLAVLMLAALVPAIFFLGLALSAGLHSFFQFPTWACDLIVAVCLGLAGFTAGKRLLELTNSRKEN